VPPPPFVHPRDACGPTFAFYQNLSKYFLLVESNCFDEGNGFRQFSESFEWVELFMNF
jgi:hypothetical protein